MYSIGLTSEFSGGNVHAALLETDGEHAIRFVAAETLAYPEATREALIAASQHDVPLVELLRLERDITAHHARAVRRLLADVELLDEISIVGFHGHTLRHVSADRLTWQLGDPSLLAEELAIPVVADFRRRDMAAGGEGAPLVSLYHAEVLADQPKPCLVLQLGDVASITWLGERGEVIAGDVGPGCVLLDAWVQEKTGKPIDGAARLAASGRIDADRVAAALKAPFFEKLLPKSADHDEFNRLISLDGLSPADGAATLAALTADAAWLAAGELPAMPRHVWVTGNGAKYAPVLLQLTARFAATGCQVASAVELGLRPDSMEAECVAWLAVRRLRGRPTSLASATGAMRATVGGLLTA